MWGRSLTQLLFECLLYARFYSGSGTSAVIKIGGVFGPKETEKIQVNELNKQFPAGEKCYEEEVQCDRNQGWTVTWLIWEGCSKEVVFEPRCERQGAS